MKFFNRFAVGVALLLLLFNPIEAKASNSFSDIRQSDDFYKEVNYIANLGIISGYQSNGKQIYKPYNNITRAQASKMLVIATGNENHNGDHIKLTDVSSTEQQYYIRKAVSLGFFKVNSNGSFKPNEYVKRSELSIALATAFNLKESVTFAKPLHFHDVGRSDSYAPHVNALYYAGLSHGDRGAFRPNSLLTRKHFALFVARALDNQFKLSVSNPQPAIVGKGKVKVNNLNVRTSPSASAGKVVGQLNTGNTFEVIGIHENWVEIKYFNRPAYISNARQYIDLLDADSKPVGSATSLVKVKTGSDTLNVRTLPSVNGVVIGKLTNNQVVEVYGEKNGWFLILMNGLPGYISASYTEKAETSSPDGNTGGSGKLIGKVTASSLNVRSGTGTNHPVIDSVKRGQKVEVTALNGNWATIKFNGKTGYVSKIYLKLINQSGSPLKDRIIVIDAGHGGSDPGAAGNGIVEKHLALDVSKRVEAKLKKVDAKVLMTRSGDTFPSLAARTEYAKKNFAETFVSIHGNAATPSASGAEVFYDTSGNPNGAESRVLAQYIQNNIVRMAGMNDRGAKDTGFYVIKNNNVAAVLVELGFMTNKADADKLKSERYKEIYAEAIYQGLVQYYSTE